MRIRFWGVRGSTPTPQSENMGYGGNTACVEVRLNENIYVFDCGTGFRNLGKELAREFGPRAIRAHLFLSHFHWDHIQGIPFFAPLYENSENRFFFHSGCRTHDWQEILHGQMAKPYFPVEMSHMAAAREFYSLDEGRNEFDGFRFQTRWLNHPQGCLGFRVEAKAGVLVYATDNEPGDAAGDRAVRELAEGADVLIYDAQYLPEEYDSQKRGWGHSHWREAVKVARDSGVKELILFHHDPDHTDACIDSLVAEAKNHYPRLRAAFEGMEISLG